MAHRQEITCVRFLDPLPCLATADMTGKVLLWATRPHANVGALLVVLRNTVITAGDAVPEVTPGLSGGRIPRARGQRKVLPTPVTCIAFHHCKISGSDPTEAAATAGQSTRQNQQGCSTAANPKVPAAAPSPWDVGSMLFTGDELGTLKVWDVTDVLLDKLGPTACGAGATEDKATIPPASFGAASHHFVHYRQGPLDGVGLQAGVRFRELIDIARVLRRGEHLQTAKSESGSDTTSRRRAGPSSSGGRVLGGVKKSKRSEAKSSVAGSLSTSGSTTAERPRDRSADGGSWKQALLRPDPEAYAGGSSSLLSTTTATESDARDGRQRARRPAGPKEQAEATLNARPDDIHPVASWTGHKDCITSMQTISSPLSIVTGSLDSSARLFSLDGSLLGVVSEKQSDKDTKQRSWLFEPPAKGRSTEASARAVALEKTLQHVRHEERQPARPGVHDAAAPIEGTPGQSRCTLSSPVDKAPNNGAELGTIFAGSKRHCASAALEDRVDRGASLVVGEAADEGAEEEGREVALERRRKCLHTRSALSALCLARISELTQGRVAEVAASSDTGSDSLHQTAEDGIEARLLSEAREGRKYQRRGVSAGLPSDDNQEEPRAKRAGLHHAAKPSSNAASEPPPAPKLPPNLTAERERKQARRTRSTLQFLSNSVNRASAGAGSMASFSPPTRSQSQKDLVLGPRVTERAQGGGGVRSRPFTSPGSRTKSPQRSKLFARDDSATTLVESTGLSPAAKLRHAVMVASPYLVMRLQGTHDQGDGEVKQADVGGGWTTGREGAAEDNGSAGAPRKSERPEEGGGGATKSAVTKLAAMPLTHRSSAPKAVVTQRSTANMLFTHRSAALASARSNRSNKPRPSVARPAVSTKAAVARRMAADRRLRRMDGILDGVRRLGQQEVGGSRHGVSRADGDPARRTATEEAATAAAAAGESGAAKTGDRGAGTVVVSARVREVLSRFGRSVDGGDDDQENADFNNQADQRARSMRRQLEARTAARQEAIRHNERYRKAQRYDLVTLQETQLRRQEAIVGLAGPSGERFGPYTYVPRVLGVRACVRAHSIFIRHSLPLFFLFFFLQECTL